MLVHENKELVREVLEDLARNNGGTITPDQVIDHARDEASPLHNYFEWNDTLAAANYRREQARSLLRSVKIVVKYETKNVKTVAYVRDPSRKLDEAGYIAVDRVKSDKDLAREVMVAEFKRAGAALSRARSLATYFNMENKLERFIAEINLLQERLSEESSSVQ